VRSESSRQEDERHDYQPYQCADYEAEEERESVLATANILHQVGDSPGEYMDPATGAFR